MGQTPGGLPWPEDTDPVMAGAQAIRALAEALEGRPFYAAERFANFQAGSAGGADFTVGLGASVWETIESNFAQKIPGTSAGFAIPRAGMWRVDACMTIYGNIAAAQAGAGVVSDSGKNVRHQRTTSGSTVVRNTFQVNAITRYLIGETLTMVLWQTSGSAQQIGGSSGGVQWATRFAAEWLAP